MFRIFLKILVPVVLLLTMIAIALIQVVDRTPYQQRSFYQVMDQRLDSLAGSYAAPRSDSSLQIGWSRVNITPPSPVPLAGYGARDPKLMEGVNDSSYVRTIVFQNSFAQVAIVTADLLIIHPELAQEVWIRLQNGWQKDQVYFSATHTHSGQGGWAPGLVGRLFSGTYDPERVRMLAKAIVQSIEKASDQMAPGAIAVGELSIDNLVKNRLVKEKGTVDPWMKVIRMKKNDQEGLLSFYSAHATCFGHDFRQLSGDFPARLCEQLMADSLINFAAYGAGAVGSMGPAVDRKNQQNAVNEMARQLKEQLDLYRMLAAGRWQQPSLRTIQLKLPMRAPQFKLSKHLALKPYVFRALAGEYAHYLSVLVMGRTMMVGMPCDFSGELAVPLYEYARDRDLNLIISSFNGDYAGYVIKDEWHDLPKYEARTMSWHGADAGAYLSEVTKRLIDIIDENR